MDIICTYDGLIASYNAVLQLTCEELFKKSVSFEELQEERECKRLKGIYRISGTDSETRTLRNKFLKGGKDLPLNSQNGYLMDVCDANKHANCEAECLTPKRRKSESITFSPTAPRAELVESLESVPPVECRDENDENRNPVFLKDEHIAEDMGDYSQKFMMQQLPCNVYQRKRSVPAMRKSMTKSFHCGQCDKYFASSSSLNRHARLHINRQPFRCTICKKKFSWRSNLKRHRVVHTNNKVFYRCDKCGKTFNDASNRNAHNLRHDVERYFVCDCCQKRYRCKRDLRNHIINSSH